MTTDISVLTNLVQSNSYIQIPPDTYVINAAAASPYPNVVGVCGAVIKDKHDFVLDCSGVTITKADGINANWLTFSGCSNFKVRGLSFQANNTGQTTGSPAGCLMLISLDRFEFSDIRILGQPWNVGVSGVWLTNGRFDRVRMEAIYEGYDLAFMQHVTFRDCVAWGIAQPGPLSGNASPWGCFNIAPDYTTATAYPNVSSLRTTGYVAIENCAAFNFAAGIAIRSGSHYRIIGNDFSFNGTASEVVPSHGGAGVLLWSNPVYPCDSNTDPIQNALIANNLFNCDLNAGVVLNAEATYAPPISRVRVVGNWLNSPRLTASYGSGNIVGLVTDA